MLSLFSVPEGTAAGLGGACLIKVIVSVDDLLADIARLCLALDALKVSIS
jgi:hypothetical protein